MLQQMQMQDVSVREGLQQLVVVIAVVQTTTAATSTQTINVKLDTVALCV
jgi:hypothetical protein